VSDVSEQGDDEESRGVQSHSAEIREMNEAAKKDVGFTAHNAGGLPSRSS